MKKVFFLLFLGVAISAGFCNVASAKYAFVYIQGDKVTPFYVKKDGKMLPRYGKNYCIIPKLDSGSIDIEILYQQNIFNPQTYTFDVPAGGCRSFLLTKKDTAYSLFDLETKAYLYPNKK